jgi:hypothetical protein
VLLLSKRTTDRLCERSAVTLADDGHGSVMAAATTSGLSADGDSNAAPPHRPS